MTRSIDFFFEADRGEVYVEVEAEYQPDEPDVGIVGGYNMESYTITDSDGNGVILTDSEERRLLEKIESKLANLEPEYFEED